MKKTLLTVMLCSAFAIGATAQTKLTLKVSTEKKHTITGFGAAALENLMRPTQDVDVIRSAYSADSPIGLNIMRMEMSPNTKGDINASDIGWDTPYDWHGQLAAVREAKRHGAIVFATPWSPPPVLKTNNSSAGGESEEQGHVRATLIEGKEPLLFQWYKNFLKYMKDNNAPVDAFSFQNEPDWWVSYSGCVYSPEQMYNTIKKGMESKRLDKSEFNARFIAGEPLGFNTDYFHRLLNDPEVNKYCDILAGHVYGNYGCKKNIATLRSWAPDKEIWMTEHSVNGEQGRYLPRWKEELDFAEDVNECIVNGCTAYIYWYLCKDFGFIYDGDKYDQASCRNWAGQKRGDILPRGYIMGHFAKNLVGATMLANTRSVADGKDTPGVNQRFELSTFIKGDSLIVNAIDTMSTSFNLEITLPYNATSVKRIQSTEGNLCVEDMPTITEGKVHTFLIQPRSFTTFIFKVDNPDAVEGIEIDDMEKQSLEMPEEYTTLSGIRTRKTYHGIYISKGKKFAH